jgi:chromosome segregation ATPase
VVDHAAASIEKLDAKVSDLRHQTHQAEQERQQAVEHLRASERARQALQLSIDHLQSQMKIAPKERRLDYGLLRKAGIDVG